MIKFNYTNYPTIPKNLHRCHLRIAARINEPYIYAFGDNDEKGYRRKVSINGGIDFNMVELVAKEMNLATFYYPKNETVLFNDLINRFKKLL